MTAVTTITMPQLGETVTEGTITRWLKNVGDPIEKYEAFAEVATDKVNAEIPSPTAGILLAILVPEGETVPTGAEIARIGNPDGVNPAPAAGAMASTGSPIESATSAASAASAASANDAASASAIASSARPEIAINASATPPRVLDAAQMRELRLSPAVRRELRKSGLDPALISGTGDNHRITLRDVQSAARTQPPASLQAQPQPQLPPQLASNPSTAARGSRVMPLSRARKTIAEHMVHAVRTIPHAWTMIEADVTGLVARRHAEQQSMRATLGFAPTYFHYFAHAVVATLAEHPLMNSRFTDTGIEVFSHVDLSFAVALPESLIVPVVRDAHRMRFEELSGAIAGVTDRARKGKLAVDELHGGTITINNTGANGSILSTPIINGGQAAIVTMESIVKRPVVVHQDAVAVRSMVNICCSIDHRAIDGDVVGGFLRHLKLRLQAYNAHP